MAKNEMANENVFTVTVWDYDGNAIQTDDYKTETDAIAAAHNISENETATVHLNDNDIPIYENPPCPF